MSRTKSSIQNLITALVGQFFGILISFVSRMVFLRCLNEEYLGLNGLFTNILTIFSLAELGVGSAINFSLYKPLAEHNTEQIKSLMRLYKKAYILIGCVIAVIGLLFTPFYTVFMDTVPDISHLTWIYWLFTANTVVSYFFSYKRALIICDEKRYIATIYRYAFYFLMNLAQIVVLILTHNYILFLILQVLFTLVENIGISNKADHMYPYLREKDVEPVPFQTRQEIHKNIGAMLLHKIAGMVVLSTDNLILSKYVSLVSVGLYSNYYLITDALNKIISQVFNSLVASVGNLNASETTEDRDKLENVFDRVFFINFWIYGFCSCCLWVLFNPFISLWLGPNMLFDRYVVSAIVINFYIYGMRKTVLMFRDATGVFYYDRYKAPAEAIVNIVLSIWLAQRCGTVGVFLGTIISSLSTCVWVEPHIVYKYVFHKSAGSYAVSFLKYTVLSASAIILSSFICDAMAIDNIYLAFVCKVIVCLIVPNSIFLLCFYRTDQFKYFIGIVKRLIRILI